MQLRAYTNSSKVSQCLVFCRDTMQSKYGFVFINFSSVNLVLVVPNEKLQSQSRTPFSTWGYAQALYTHYLHFTLVYNTYFTSIHKTTLTFSEDITGDTSSTLSRLNIFGPSSRGISVHYHLHYLFTITHGLSLQKSLCVETSTFNFDPHKIYFKSFPICHVLSGTEVQVWVLFLISFLTLVIVVFLIQYMS